MSGGYSPISNYSRVEIMHLIQTSPRRTVAEISAATNLHPNTVREHLQRLMDAGHVLQEREVRTVRGRPRVLYSAATGETSETSSPIAKERVQAAAKRGDLMRRALPHTAGSLETKATHQMDAVIDDLIDAGFDPLIDEENLTIDLTPCPHATSQADHRDTLCSVHLGLIQGVLNEAGGPLEVVGMEPSCNPADCVIHLRRTDAN